MRGLCLGLALLSAAAPVQAGPVKNPIAVLAGLDKITGVTTTFEAKIDQAVRFGGLTVTPRVCYSRPVTEEPKTTAFVEVVENATDGTNRRVFTGWMLAESPGLSGLEHPVYDVWLTSCRDPDAPPVIVEAPPEPEKPGEGEGEEADD